MKNQQMDLNNHLFAQLERLSDEKLTTEELQHEAERSKAIIGVAKEIMSESDKALRDFNDILQAESNEKIKKAMQYFIKSDDVFRRVFMHSSGFAGELTAKNLRNHFDTMDLMDVIDDVIDDFEFELGIEQ